MIRCLTPPGRGKDIFLFCNMYSSQGVKLTIQLHPVLRLRNSGAIPLFPSYCLEDTDSDNFTRWSMSFRYFYQHFVPVHPTCLICCNLIMLR